uniref:Longitudinals lacking protein, isoforms A/B/D/L n=1 Tax=Lygus hesperus TaxID=30085 RepID=A0A0A9XFJ3_LYGHE
MCCTNLLIEVPDLFSTSKHQYLFMIVSLLFRLVPGPFFCPSCPRKYKYKGDLTRHINYECGKAPMFKCPFCDHRVKRKSNMKTHIGIVHGTIIRNHQHIIETVP